VQDQGAVEILGIRAAISFLLMALVAWLWPIGFGGRMLVGGDVTRFFMGLMAVLGESLRAGHLPIWNDLWGYGFPGLAESQMGVYYPPHLLFYGLFRVETAYVVSLVAHTLWGGLGAFWAARKFGISAAGSTLAAFSWAAGGFFVIHMSHPWGYSAGCWMPWAWGLAWTILAERYDSLRRPLFFLSLLLFLQLLPGHFQIAFMTQVGIAALLVWKFWDFLWAKRNFKTAADTSAVSRSLGRTFRLSGMVLIGLAVAFPLAAMQIWPTARLAKLADQQRDFAYLMGFASTPFHLVSYVAPGLFHRAPSWRPLVWDPFVTSPEEHMAYVGLVPLLLALLAMFRDRKSDPGIRALTFLTLMSLYLSLGPNVPGFRSLIEIPGFSFFRAPARWSLAVSMALALLAGKGFDLWPGQSRPGRWIAGFVALAVFWIGGILTPIELSLSTNGRSDTAELLRRGFSMVSWASPRDWDRVVAAARQPVMDAQIPEPLAKLNLRDVSRATPSFADQRKSIYLEELGPTLLILGLLGMAGILQLSRRGRAASPVILLALTFVDLLLLSRHRMSDLETAPWRPLSEQSPVLAELFRNPRGTRSVDPFRNFPMIAGLAPVSAYRTMDLPVAMELTQLTHVPLDFFGSAPRALASMRAVGAGIRSLDPVENLLANRADQLQGDRGTTSDLSAKPAWDRGKPIDDPALAAWQYGAAWVQRQGSWATSYRLATSPEPPTRAWLIDPGGMVGQLPDVLARSDASSMLRTFERAMPLKSESTRPGSRTVEVTNPPPTGWIVVTELSDTQWAAHWVGQEGQGERPAEIRPVFHGRYAWGWQGVKSPGPGRWTLVLDYDARDVRQGLLASAVAWALWIGFLVGTRKAAFWRLSRPAQSLWVASPELPGTIPIRVGEGPRL